MIHVQNTSLDIAGLLLNTFHIQFQFAFIATVMFKLCVENCFLFVKAFEFFSHSDLFSGCLNQSCIVRFFAMLSVAV